jgi:hypothetical protein
MNNLSDSKAFDAILTEGEQALVEHLVELLGAALAKRYAEKEMLRAAHPKAHGLVKGEFIVNDEVPEGMRQGIFKEPGRRFEAWIRFSNAGALPAADRDKDLRGCAIRLMGVEGPSLLAESTQTQDLLLQSSERFIVATPQEFADFSKWIVRGKPMLYFLTHPRYMLAGLRAIRGPENPLGITYWSAVPYGLGTEAAVKYKLVPNDSYDSQKLSAEPDAMRRVMIESLAHTKASFDFQIQTFVSEKQTPIDDAWKIWDESKSSPVSVARLEIPAQVFATSERDLIAEEMAFNPWHGLSAHRPLGSMNRVRGALYSALAQLRSRANGFGEIPQPEFDVSQPEDTGAGSEA